MEENIIGIDLGTTLSVIARLDNLGTPHTIPNCDGERLTASVIYFNDDESILIGQEAKNSAREESSRVVKEFKREMDNPDYTFEADGKAYAALELSAMVLKKLIQDASEEIGEIHKVVITVPAYFKEIQRNATMEAGKIAGVEVIAIINEPTAAALFYAKESNIEGCGIVYDLGGGTFDITLTDTKGKNIQVLGSEGDARLGGIDFDKIILDIMREKYKAQTDDELCSDASSQEEFSQMAEEIKKSLSKKTSVKKQLVRVSNRASIEITREEFEEKASILISKTEMLLEQLLDETGHSKEDIDYVLLAGGSTRIPAIRESIKKTLGIEARNAVNVDEVVALGAAIKAGLVMENKFPEMVKESIKPALIQIIVQDVANHSYGVVMVNNNNKDFNNIIITKNTALPCIEKTIGFLRHNGQNEVQCQITQGEEDEVQHIDIINTFHLSIDNYDTKEGDKVDFIYTYDENQIMHCKVTHLLSNSSIEHSLNIESLNHKSNRLTSHALDKFLIE